MNQPTLQPAWLSLKGAQAYTGLSIRTLRRRVAEKAFETSLRGVRLINRESLERWVKDGVTDCQTTEKKS